MTRQRVNTQRSSGEVIGFALRKQFDHVLEIEQAVVDRRGSELKDGFSSTEIKHAPVTRTAFETWVTEVVRLVNYEGVCQLLYCIQLRWEFTAAKQVRVVQNFQITKNLTDIRQISAERSFPNRHARRLRHYEDDALALVDNQSFDE